MKLDLPYMGRTSSMFPNQTNQNDPKGICGNSPAFQCRVRNRKHISPDGTTGQMQNNFKRMCCNGFLVFLGFLAAIPVFASNGTIQIDTGKKLITLADGHGDLVLRLNYNDRCILDQVIVRGREVAADSASAPASVKMANGSRLAIFRHPKRLHMEIRSP